MMKELTRDQFRAQFNQVVTPSDELRAIMSIYAVIHGFVIYTMMEKLALLDPADGLFYIHS